MTKFRMPYVYFVLIVAVLGGINACKNKKELPRTNTTDEKIEQSATENLSDVKPAEVLADDQSIEDSVLIKWEKTPCFGTCPVFTVTVFKSGLVIYEGKKFTSMQGVYYSFISDKALDEIYRLAEEIDFFKMSKEFDCNITDLPSTILYLRLGNKKNEVMWRCNFPENLKELDRLIDHHINTLKWKLFNDKKGQK